MNTKALVLIGRKIIYLLITLLTLLILSCTFSSLTGGVVILHISESVSNVKNLIPSIDMTPASYRVSGVSQDGESFTPVTITGTTTSIEKLAAGSWTITVDAYNSDSTPTKIGTGLTSVTVTNGRTTDTAVTVRPLTGNGTLTVNLTWPSDVLVNPQVVATLKPTTGTTQTLNFTVNATSANFSSSTLAAGYYTLSIALNEGTTTVAGKAETVRIVADQTTTGIYNFTNLNPAGGTASVTITPEMANPFVVSINGGQSTMTVGASQTLTAVVSNYPGSLTYAWYINGIDQNVSTATWTCGADWKIGTHTIDAIATSLDGSQAGNGTLTITVEPNVYVGGWITNAKGIQIPGYWKNGTWNELPSTLDRQTYLRDLIIDKSDIYACGIWYDPNNSKYVPGYWKNSIWTELPTSEKGGEVNTIAIHNSIVFAAGHYINSAGFQVPCYWENGIKTDLPNIYSSSGGTVNSIAFANDSVYFGGYSSNANPVRIPGYWKNGEWIELPSVSHQTQAAEIYSILIFDRDVYAGGYDFINGKITAGYWKNGTWVGLSPATVDESKIYSMILSGNDIYATGSYIVAGIPKPVYWKNGVLVDLQPLSPTRSSFPYKIAVQGNSVYVIGYSGDGRGEFSFGYWKNGEWVYLTYGIIAYVSAIAFSPL
jgi:hypothetical protein